MVPKRPVTKALAVFVSTLLLTSKTRPPEIPARRGQVEDLPFERRVLHRPVVVEQRVDPDRGDQRHEREERHDQSAPTISHHVLGARLITRNGTQAKQNPPTIRRPSALSESPNHLPNVCRESP